MPTFRDDNIVHISVSKDNPREGTPSSSKVQSTRTRDFTVDKAKASVLQHTASSLCCYCPCHWCYCVQMTSLNDLTTHTIKSVLADSGSLSHGQRQDGSRICRFRVLFWKYKCCYLHYSNRLTSNRFDQLWLRFELFFSN